MPEALYDRIAANPAQWAQWHDLGIRNLDLDDPKFGLFREVKKLEGEIGDGSLSLNAFIMSETEFGDLLNSRRLNRADLEARNVLFMEKSNSSYIDQLFRAIVAPR